MSISRVALFFGIPFAAWLLLGMPAWPEISAIWLPVTLFLIFWALTVFHSAWMRISGVDWDVYDNVVPWFGTTLTLGFAVVALGIGATALFVGNPVRAAVSSGPAIGLAVVVLLFVALAPRLFARRTLGERGQRSIEDPRPVMRSAAAPPRTLDGVARGEVESTDQESTQ